MQNYIHGDKFVEIADFLFSDRHRQSFDILKGRSGIVFCKTDYLPEFFDRIKDSNDNYVLITHNSDLVIDERVYNSKPQNIKSWFAQNVVVEHPDLIPIPIGMERPGISFHGDYELLLNIKGQKSNKINTAFFSMRVDTNTSIRRPIADYFRDIPWVTYENRITDFKSYLIGLEKHKYVISPPGNGPDCHRTWEAIYMGVIPIVLKSPFTNYFSNLPILLVDSYDMVTNELLLSEFDNIIKKPVDMAYMPYWIDMIKRRAHELL